jgi:hypothetical protein
MSRPSIDHTILSPSGRVSRRAREAALNREAERLFPPGYWDAPEPTPEEKRAAEILRLRRHAANLRDLAARGMSRRRFTAEAESAESKAAALDKEASE